ncbi:rRNA-processing protein EBP2 [Naganishia albida]|nr:rRNA-processing protein EBP2 [Naganishia albida]
MGKKSRQSTGSQAAASPATTPKPKKQTPTKSTPVAKAPSPEPEVQADEEDWEDEDSEEENEDDDGVTEEGMQRLMALLEKENALDDFDMAQLGEGSDEEDEEASDDDEEEEGDDDDETDAQIDELADEPAKPSKRVRISTEEDVQSASEGDLALDDLESDLSVDEDAIPQRKVTKNNKAALEVLREGIMVTNMPFGEHLTLTSYEDHSEVDPSDDLKREMAFYKQALSVVEKAKKMCQKSDIPFTRPTDYYAEMIKSDAQMARLRSHLVEEAASIKKSEQARKQRELKKYGKEIQHEKLKQRLQDKKGLDERLRGVKRKRKDGAELSGEDGDGFDVALGDAIEGKGNAGKGKDGKDGKRGGKDGPRMPRHARDSKYRMGGGGKRSKENDRESTNDFNFSKGKGGPGGAKGAKGKPNRPGKSRRNNKR